MSHQAAFTSPIAFGEDEGSQWSGVTLVLRLWPLLQQVKTTRVYWRSNLYSMHRKILRMPAVWDVDLTPVDADRPAACRPGRLRFRWRRIRARHACP
jgi:hypothetical protein